MTQEGVFAKAPVHNRTGAFLMRRNKIIPAFANGGRDDFAGCRFFALTFYNERTGLPAARISCTRAAILPPG